MFIFGTNDENHLNFTSEVLTFWAMENGFHNQKSVDHGSENIWNGKTTQIPH